jgi:hypothetical protein
MSGLFFLFTLLVYFCGLADCTYFKMMWCMGFACAGVAVGSGEDRWLLSPLLVLSPAT